MNITELRDKLNQILENQKTSTYPCAEPECRVLLVADKLLFEIKEIYKDDAPFKNTGSVLIEGIPLIKV